MGLGLSYHSNAKLDVSVPNSSLNGVHEFDDAVGSVAQIGWAPAGSKYSVDLRYTTATFKVKGVANAKDINGNVAGLYASYYF
jgi:hypothetical protein